MRIAEGVVDVDIGEARQFPGEFLVVFLLSGIEPEVLQHDNVARLHGIDGFLDLRPDDVLRQGHVLAKQPRESLGHGGQAHLFDELAFRPAEVGGDDDLGVFIEGVVDGGQYGTDSRVIGDVLVAVEGDVEVEPEQHPFPFQIHLIDIFHSFTSGGFVGGPFAHPLGVEVAGMGFIAQVSS